MTGVSAARDRLPPALAEPGAAPPCAPSPVNRHPSPHFSVTFALPATVAPPLGVYASCTVSFTLFAFLSDLTAAFVNFSVTVPLPEPAILPLPEATAFDPFRPLTVSVPAPGPANFTLTPLFSAFFSEVLVNETDSWVAGGFACPLSPPGGGVVVEPLLLTVSQSVETVSIASALTVSLPTPQLMLSASPSRASIRSLPNGSLQ